MIIIQNINANKTTMTPQRLQFLLTAAQQGDKSALLQLCQAFTPLLRSESRREMFYKSLGKDAEGIAVLAFIELVLKYEGSDFINWPGYARCRVHFALFDAMKKQGSIWEHETQVDTKSEAVIQLLDNTNESVRRPDEMARLLLSLEVQAALAQLSSVQQQVLTMLFVKDMKPSEAAKQLGCTVRNITKHRLKALDKLRELLAAES